MNKMAFLSRLFRDGRQYRLLLLISLATCFDVFLVQARFALKQAHAYPSGDFIWPELQAFFGLSWSFLTWNLFLAWIPCLAALLFERLQAAGASRWALLIWFGIWLAFLPNAPYIVTDFIHLEPRPPIPVWYDMVLLFSYACTGMALGVFSLYEVHQALRRQFSGKIAHLIIFGASGLAGFGVWLGRFLRWNSWDILTNPAGLLRDILQTLANRYELIKALGISGLMGAVLLMGYLMLYAVLATDRQT